MFKYERHDPKNTLLYKIIKEYYPVYLSHLGEEGRTLPLYIQQEFANYLKCGLMEHGFWRIRCESCHHERMVAFSCKQRGFCPSCCAKRMVESSALLVDTILPRQPMRQWVLSVPFPLRFLFASQPNVMSKVLGIVYRTLATYLIKKAGYSKKTARTGAVTLIQRFGSALNLNVYFQSQKGKKIFSLQTLPPIVDEMQNEFLGKVAGFSLHAGVSVKAWQRDKLERLCRYISRPPVSALRLSLTESGNIRYELKTPYRNGTTHVVFEPLDFISKLAALVPSPRANLTRFHGVFAPNNKHRAGPREEDKALEETVPTAIEKQGAMRWAARLKRAFNIDIKTCEVCGGAVKVIACIDEPIAIKKILDHLQAYQSNQVILPITRAPPIDAA